MPLSLLLLLLFSLFLTSKVMTLMEDLMPTHLQAAA